MINSKINLESPVKPICMVDLPGNEGAEYQIPTHDILTQIMLDSKIKLSPKINT